MILSYDYASPKRGQQQMKAPPWQAFLIAMAVRQCNNTHIYQWRNSRAFIKATKHHHRATTHSVLPRWPPGWQQTKWRCKMCPLCWPFWWPSWSAHIAQWRRFLAFGKATKRRHQASTCSDSINWTRLPLILGVYFIVKSLKKNLSCLNNNWGVTHHTDEKHRNNSLLGWLK